jgi:hypothetical protein
MKTTTHKVALPTRSAVLSKLADLADGNLSPEDASAWAETWLLIDQTPGADVQIKDWPVWEALKVLAGADLQAEPGTYLHGSKDFLDWLQQLRNAPLPPDEQCERQ